MTPDMLNPAICSSALDQDGNNAHADEGPRGGYHIWDTTTTPNTCAECGADRDEFTDPK